MEQSQQSPFASEGSPYPLLTAWYYGRLKQAFDGRTLDIYDTSPMRLQQARELAAAQLVVELDDERTQLEKQVQQMVQENHHPDFTNHTNDFIIFYDGLQLREDLGSYRQILQDLSGTRTMLTDEQEYREKRGH